MNNIKKYLPILLIFLFGLIVRLYYFKNNQVLLPDMARDLLAGLHIAKYGELSLVGHASSGIYPFYYYPPLYFYIMGLLNLLTSNTYILLILLIIWMSISIIFVYLISQELFDFKVALFAALFEALSQNRIRTHMYLYSSLLTCPLLLLSIYCFLIAKKNGKFRYVCYSMSALVFGGMISHTLMPFVLLFLFIFILNKKFSILQKFYLFIFSYFFFLF